jgi:hypothetical protein
VRAKVPAGTWLRIVGCGLGLLAPAAGGCNERTDRARATGARPAFVPSQLPSARPRRQAKLEEAAPRGAPEPSPSLAASLSPVPSAVELAPSQDAAPLPSGPFLIDELVDVAPAGPATAHDLGVVLVTKSDALVVARRGALSHTKGAATTPIATLDRPRAAFAPYARGPAIAGRFAYWISQGRLVRRQLDGTGELEVLAPEARQGTRVAAVSSGGTAVVAYVTRPPAPDEPPRARLWVDGARYELTPDGSGASSVAIAPQGDSFIVVALDGRSGMTPLHARRVRLGPKKGEVVLGPDQVVWVGGGAQATTEIAATARADEVWAFLAIERDVTHFGLAQIRIGREPRVDLPVSWLPFPNGINTSPVAAARVCGRQALVFARPSTAAPFAPQELVLAELGADGLVSGDVVVRAKAFADASFSSVEGGALLAYTADHRTWAAAIRCRRP